MAHVKRLTQSADNVQSEALQKREAGMTTTIRIYVSVQSLYICNIKPMHMNTHNPSMCIRMCMCEKTDAHEHKVWSSTYAYIRMTYVCTSMH